MNSGGLASMTAFASAEAGEGGLLWSWEMRSVNGRGLDLRLRLPDGLSALEQREGVSGVDEKRSRGG